MAKHHPDLIFCRKQAGVGEWRPAPFCLNGMVLESGGLGTFSSSLGLWFGGSTFRALRSLCILEALTGLWLLRREQERASGSIRLAGASVPGLEKLF